MRKLNTEIDKMQKEQDVNSRSKKKQTKKPLGKEFLDGKQIVI